MCSIGIALGRGGRRGYECDPEAVKTPGACEEPHSATDEAFGSDESSALLLARDRCMFLRLARLHSMASCAGHRPEGRLPMRAASRCAGGCDARQRMTGVCAGSLHVVAMLVVLPMHGWIIATGRSTMLLRMTLGKGNCRVGKCT